jgi:hypothetical protein
VSTAPIDDAPAKLSLANAVTPFVHVASLDAESTPQLLQPCHKNIISHYPPNPYIELRHDALPASLGLPQLLVSYTLYYLIGEHLH